MKLPLSSAVRKRAWQRHPDGQYSLPDLHPGIMVLPLMIFHQIQLMVCAVLAALKPAKPMRAEKANAPKA
jgi:predicted Na+-dependent transporter